MEELENDTNVSMLIGFSNLVNPTFQFEVKFVGLLVTYIVGTYYKLDLQSIGSSL